MPVTDTNTRFEVVAGLGSGSFGCVQLVRDRASKKELAMKARGGRGGLV